MELERDTTRIDQVTSERAKLRRENTTVTKELVDLELVKDAPGFTNPRKFLKITDPPSNWEVREDYNFEEWKQSKIAAGTWVERLINL